MAKITVETRQAPNSSNHYVAIVTIRGRCHYAIYAGECPSNAKVTEDYLSDKKTSRAKNWQPYYA